MRKHVSSLAAPGNRSGFYFSFTVHPFLQISCTFAADYEENRTGNSCIIA